VVMMPIAMMMVGLSSHIHNGCRHSQHGRIFILDPLRYSLADDIKEQNEPQNNK
jgi:hypothetical protein